MLGVIFGTAGVLLAGCEMYILYIQLKPAVINTKSDKYAYSRDNNTENSNCQFKLLKRSFAAGCVAGIGILCFIIGVVDLTI